MQIAKGVVTKSHKTTFGRLSQRFAISTLLRTSFQYKPPDMFKWEF